MDAKEVGVRGKALQKAVEGGDPPDVLLGILSELRKNVKASELLLRTTGIGRTVNNLKKHKNPDVQKAGNELVSKWRLDVRRAQATASSGTSTPKPPNGTSSPAPTASPAPVLKKKHHVPPEKRSAKEDKIDTSITGSDIRDNCLKLMYDGLAHMSEDLPDDVLRVAREVELAAYNKYQPETSAEYKGKIRSLYQNLKNKSNPKLRVRVLSGEVSAARFVIMSHDELKSAERRAEDEALEKENMREAMVAQVEKSVSKTFTCGKCGQKKVAYSQAQTRSADEPMTTFCECMNCGNRWKFS